MTWFELSNIITTLVRFLIYSNLVYSDPCSLDLPCRMAMSAVFTCSYSCTSFLHTPVLSASSILHPAFYLPILQRLSPKTHCIYSTLVYPYHLTLTHSLQMTNPSQECWISPSPSSFMPCFPLRCLPSRDDHGKNALNISCLCITLLHATPLLYPIHSLAYCSSLFSHTKRDLSFVPHILTLKTFS